MGQKRKRLALSCVDCRRRKVKCDRNYPICQRCQKNGNADSCLYVSHTGLEADLSPPPSEHSPNQQNGAASQVETTREPYALAALPETSPHLDVPARQPPPPNPPRLEDNSDLLHSLFGRVTQLETFTRMAGSKPMPVGLYSDTSSKPILDREAELNPASDFSKVMIRGKNFGTHYYGPSFAISMLLQFEDLSKFVRDMLTQVPALSKMKEKMTATRIASKSAKQKAILVEKVDLHGMVPPREIADKLVREYFDTIEQTYRILHVPTFYRQYKAYWENPAATKPDFIVVMLSVMACMYTIVPGGPAGFIGRMSARREVAVKWLAACESWLDEQSLKYITLLHFQAHVLLFVGKAINCVKIKREWTNSGMLLRFAMAIGMHREPSLLSKRIDVFDQELRRRLWFTIVELDLLTTLSRGMPPTIDSFSWDCLPPRNIDDEDFDQKTEVLPPSKPRSVYTRTSFLHVATENLPLRVEVLGRINSIRLGLDIDAVMQYDSKLRGVIDDLPKWQSDRPVFFAQDLSLLSLYDYILVLHIPFASQTSKKAKTFYSVASKRDISYKTLQIYARTPEQERLIFTDIRDDACRAVLSLAHDMATNMNTDIVFDHQRALDYVEIIVDSLARRFCSLGQGFHSFWISLSAFSLLRWKVSPDEPPDRFAREAAERIGNEFEQILAHQVSPPLPNGDISHTEGFDPITTPSMNGSLESFDVAFPGFDQLNFFDDPFSDMNFDLTAILDTSGFEPL